MEKKTFVPERKAYLAPAAKTHFIEIEDNIMSIVTQKKMVVIFLNQGNYEDSF